MFNFVELVISCLYNFIVLPFFISFFLFRLQFIVTGFCNFFIFYFQNRILRLLNSFSDLKFFRIFTVLFYVGFSIFFLSYFRFNNMDREIDSKILYFKIKEYLEYLYFFFDYSVIYFFINLFLIIFLGIQILIFFLKILKLYYFYITTCFLVFHYKLMVNKRYYSFVRFIRSILLRIDGKILFFACDLSFYLFKPGGLMLEFRRVFLWFPIFIVKFLPLLLLISIFIYDCFFNNFVILHIFYIISGIPLYFGILKITSFFFHLSTWHMVYFNEKIKKNDRSD